MPNTEKDLLKLKDTKNSILKLSLATLIIIVVWKFIISNIWKNYGSNYQGFYSATSSMVFFVIAIFYIVYISHQLNLRVIIYSILAVFSIFVYLNGVNRYISIDTSALIAYLYYNSRGIGKLITHILLFLNEYTGDSFYEALLTWVIIDVPVQIWENKVNKEWETSVKYVYYSISNQIMFFSLIDSDINALQIQNNQSYNKKIESFCEKKIKQYSHELWLHKENSILFGRHLQIKEMKEQYEYFLSLLKEIQSNPNHLGGHEYLKLLYEAEAIFKRSKIIIDNG